MTKQFEQFLEDTMGYNAAGKSQARTVRNYVLDDLLTRLEKQQVNNHDWVDGAEGDPAKCVLWEDLIYTIEELLK